VWTGVKSGTPRQLAVTVTRRRTGRFAGRHVRDRQSGPQNRTGGNDPEPDAHAACRFSKAAARAGSEFDQPGLERTGSFIVANADNCRSPTPLDWLLAAQVPPFVEMQRPISAVVVASRCSAEAGNALGLARIARLQQRRRFVGKGFGKMQTIGVGLIGYGLGGRAFHAPYVRTTPGMALRAVVSRDRDKVRADLPDMRVVPSVEALLEEPGIDLVIVSSPDALHAGHAMAALEAGKHVLVDKPFATSLADARRVLAASQTTDRLLTIFHNRRWDADFLTVQKLIAEGRLGEIVQFESHFDRWRPAAASTWKEARDGGSWLDLGPHLVDQALVLFGRPQGICADIATLRADAPAPDYFHAVLRYPDKRVILHASKLVAANDLRFAVHGTGGSWIKRGVDPQEAATVAGQDPGGPDWGYDPDQGSLTQGDPQRTEILPNCRGDYRRFWQALGAAIRGEGPNPVPGIEAMTVMEVLDAGLRSAARRSEVSL
jgi:predicted dehydrogenase